METQKEQPGELPDEKYQHPRPPVGNMLGAGFLAVFFFLAPLELTEIFVSPLENPESQVASAASVYDPYANVKLSATSAIVVDLTNGKTLFALNTDTQLPLASLTKIALVQAASEVLLPDDIIFVARDITSAG